MHRIGIFACIALVATTAIGMAQDAFQELKGDHFIVYYRQDKLFAQEVLRAAEGYYYSIAKNLGYDRFDNFWTWERRVKIFVFAGREEYLMNTRVAGWSEGFANYEHKVIVAYSAVDGFLERVLPHEITHLMFRDFVGMRDSVPIWLDEGVALSQEMNRRKDLFALIAVAVQKNALIPLNVVVQVKTENAIHPKAVALFYAEATGVVEYLMDTFGRDKFIEFCKSLRDGYGMDESLRRVYRQDSIENLQNLQGKWVEFIRALQKEDRIVT